MTAPAVAKSAPRTAVSPTRRDNYPEWYQQVIRAADMAEMSGVRGCMVIKPWGYGIWERMTRDLDRRFKETGHENAYFPLFIPVSLLQKEADHVDGFAKEMAVVTHHRLVMRDGKLVPDGELDEPLVVRPTSETIIGEAFARWVKSYRDLPVLINQWANVVRWEMRPRIFLRTAEFLWQEGHTAHASEIEARTETATMLKVYQEFAENVLALPVIPGEKTPHERFPGAVNTYCIEAMMQDGKALQAGTSHFLGQNFAKAFDVLFTNKENRQEHVWATSWGVSTRLMGALIMTHSDDNGLVLPPKLAPVQVVIVPIAKNDEQLDALRTFVKPMVDALRAKGITVKLDDDDKKKPGWKFAEYEFKGYPVRIAVGPRDMENGTVEVARRDTLEKQVMQATDIAEKVEHLLEAIQDNLYQKALAMRERYTRAVDTYEEFKVAIEEGGFILAHWDGTAETEERVKEETKATIRCIPLEGDQTPGTCMVTGRPSPRRVIFARAY